MPADHYTKVKAFYLAATRDAFLVQCGRNKRESWIPFSLIHGGDERVIRRAERDDPIEFRLFDWKAEELDL